MIEGCRERATDVLRSVEIRLPGHPTLVPIGDLNVCPAHKRRLSVGARTRIRDDVITAAMTKRR